MGVIFWRNVSRLRLMEERPRGTSRGVVVNFILCGGCSIVWDVRIICICVLRFVLLFLVINIIFIDFFCYFIIFIDFSYYFIIFIITIFSVIIISVFYYIFFKLFCYYSIINFMINFTPTFTRNRRDLWGIPIKTYEKSC